MPIYEFICQGCRNNFELLAIKKGEMIEIKCPHCGSKNLERVLSRVNVSSGGPSGKKSPLVESRTCSSGTCSTITLPGHSK